MDPVQRNEAAIAAAVSAVEAARASGDAWALLEARGELLDAYAEAAGDLDDSGYEAPAAWDADARACVDAVVEQCAELGAVPGAFRPDLAEAAGNAVFRLECLSDDDAEITAATERVLELMLAWLRDGADEAVYGFAPVAREQLRRLARYGSAENALPYSQRFLFHVEPHAGAEPLWRPRVLADVYGEHARFLDEAGAARLAVPFLERAIALAEAGDLTGVRERDAYARLLDRYATLLEATRGAAGAVDASARAVAVAPEPWRMDRHRDLLADAGDTASALTAAKDAVSAWETAEPARPRDLVIALRRLAHLTRTAGRPEEAADTTVRAAALAEGVDARTRAETLRTAVWHLLKTDRHAEALAHSDRELAAWEEALHGVTDHRRRANAANNRAVALNHLHRYAESLEYSAYAVAVYDLLGDEYRADLGNALFNRQAAHGHLRDHAGALACTARMIEVYDALAAADPGDHPAERAEAHMLHAGHLSKLERHRPALRKAAWAMTLWDAVIERQPGEHTAAYADAMTSRMTVMDAAGEPASALLALSKRIVALEEEMAAEHPERRVSKRALAYANHSRALPSARDGLVYSARAVAVCEEHADRLPDDARLAACLDVHAVRLMELRRYAEAAEYSGRAVACFEALLATDRHLYMPGASGAVVNHALMLAKAGRLEEAVTEGRRALSLLEELGGDVRRSRALVLGNLAGALRRLDRTGESVELTGEVLALREALTAPGGPERHADLGLALLNHAWALAGDGNPAGALPYSARAVEVFEDLARTQPGAHLAQLATATGNHASYLCQVDRDAEAAATSRRAVELCEELAARDAEVYLPDLESAVAWSVKYHDWAGLPAEATALVLRRAALLERLAAADPDRRRDLFAALASAVKRLIRAGRNADAACAARRSVELARGLSDEDGRRHRLRDTLADLAWALGEDDPEAALAATGEALELAEEPAEPGAHPYRLAFALDNHASMLAGTGRHAEALELSARALPAWEALAAEGRNADDLAWCLAHRAESLIETGRTGEALAAAERAVGTYRELYAERPGLREDRAYALRVYARSLRAAGRDEDADAAEGEAAGLTADGGKGGAQTPAAAGVNGEARPEASAPDADTTAPTATAPRPHGEEDPS